MPRTATDTRELLLQAAEVLTLERGFSSTTVDRVIARAGVTKGAFFHHFPSKSDLARALAERHAVADTGYLEANLARAERLARDPLQQVLLFVGFFEEIFQGLDEPRGCLFASYLYELELFDEAIRARIRRQFDLWKQRVGAKLREVAAAHPPRVRVDCDEVADHLTVVFEGAFLLGRAHADPRAVARHLAHYRRYLELLFGAV